MKSWTRLARPAALAFALTLAAALPVHAAVKAWLDNTQVAPGDSVQLTLQHDGQGGGEPDLSALKQDFDILSTSRGSSMQIINGSVSSQTQLQLTLSPKHSGRITIPAISWDGEQSAPLTLEVSGSAGSAAAGSGPAAGRDADGQSTFLDVQLGTRQPYVQAAVPITVRLYSSRPLYQAELDFPPTSAALVERVGGDANTTVTRNGRPYQVLERHYLIFPQRSGTVNLPGPVLSAQVADNQGGHLFSDDPFAGFFGGSSLAGVLGTRPIRLHGDAITLDVKPRPAAATGSYWLPAQHVTLDSQWRPGSLQVHAGDPVTLTLRLQARGLTAAQLPDLSALLNLPAGLKAYPDQATLTNTPTDDTLIGRREQNVALIADQPGTYTVPALRLTWWDTQNNQARSVSLPARVLTILPAAGAVPSQAAPLPVPAAATGTATASPTASAGKAPSLRPAVAPAHDTAAAAAAGSNNLWRWLGIGAIVLWLATVMLWLVARRRRHRAGAPTALQAAATAPAADAAYAADAASARRAFRDACRRNDAFAARRALLAWSAAHWRASPPAGLSALSQRLSDPHQAALLQALDRACYADAGTASGQDGPHWNGAQLMTALTQLPPAVGERSRSDSLLAPLYPGLQ